MVAPLRRATSHSGLSHVLPEAIITAYVALGLRQQAALLVVR